MTHGHAHEEADHAAHHAADPFDKRVAMAMVVIAAVLAGVKVLGHRAHNDTLGYQIKAGVANTEAANLRSFFQSKRQRMELANLQSSQLELIAPLSPLEKVTPASTDEPLPDRERAQKEILADLKQEEVENAEEHADKIVAAGEKRYQALRKASYSARRAEQITRLEMNRSRYRLEADAINRRAEKKVKTAQDYQDKSAHKHHQSNYFDLGELGVELGLVLCSVAILSKRPAYWFGGMGTAAVGVVVVLIGFFV